MALSVSLVDHRDAEIPPGLFGGAEKEAQGSDAAEVGSSYAH